MCTITAVVAKNNDASLNVVKNFSIAGGVLGGVSVCALGLQTAIPDSTRSGAICCFTTSLALAIGLGGVGLANVGGIAIMAAGFAGGLCAWGTVTNGIEYYYSTNNSDPTQPLLGVTVAAPTTPPTTLTRA